MAGVRARLCLALMAVASVAPLACAVAVTALDEAAFYARPGEIPNVTELEYDNATDYLVVMNGTAVALLRGAPDNYSPVVDLITITRVLWTNADAAQNATNATTDQIARDITSSADRIESAIRAKLYFERSQEFYEFEGASANVTAGYANPRKVELAELDRIVEGMMVNLANLQRAKTRDAAGRYASDFDEYHAKAAALLRQYRDLLPAYREMVIAMMGSSNAIQANVRRGAMSGTEAADAQHGIDALWSDVIAYEAILVSGKNIDNGTREAISNITARAIILTAPPKRETGVPGWAVALVGIAFLSVAAFAAFVYRQKIISKAAAINPGVTDRISGGLDTVNRKLRDIERME